MISNPVLLHDPSPFGPEEAGIRHHFKVSAEISLVAQRKQSFATEARRFKPVPRSAAFLWDRIHEMKLTTSGSWTCDVAFEVFVQFGAVEPTEWLLSRINAVSLL